MATKTTNIDPKLVEFDEKNPRGEKKEIIEKDKSFNDLKKSISKYGVLVPLIIRKTKNSAHKLVDGERRLRAAILTKQQTIPAHVIESKDSDARIMAYQIHMNVKQWSKVANIRSIKEIRNDLLNENKKISENEIIKKIKEMTSIGSSELNDIFTLFKYEDKIISKVMNGEILRSYFIEIEKYLLPNLNKYFPGLYAKYSEIKLRKILAKKAENGKLEGTRYIRDKIKPLFNTLGSDLRLQNAFKKFFDNADIPISSIVKSLDGKKKPIKTKTASIKKSDSPENRSKKSGDPKFISKIKISKTLETKILDIKPQFEKIENKLTDIEIEYIKEAIYCLNNHCFKAAALMIWAANISRILSYINKDIPRFNTASQEMKNDPKSVYRQIAKDFQLNATTVDDIRLCSKDLQLLCYLFYCKIISDTQFNKLKSNFTTRCDCAHPTDILITSNEIIAIFENSLKLIFNNPKLL